MAKSKKVLLACTECLIVNYQVNQSTEEKRLEIKKHCPKCRKHTIHKGNRK